MPCRVAAYIQRRRCRKPYTWSTYRGGCRFEPNHAGACKPKAGKR